MNLETKNAKNDKFQDAASNGIFEEEALFIIHELTLTWYITIGLQIS